MPAAFFIPVQLRKLAAEDVKQKVPGSGTRCECGDRFPFGSLVMSINKSRTGGSEPERLPDPKVQTSIRLIMMITGWRGTGGTGAERTVPQAPPEDKQEGGDKHGVGI